MRYRLVLQQLAQAQPLVFPQQEQQVQQLQQLVQVLLALGDQKQATVLLEQMADQQPEQWQLRLLLAELRRNGNDRAGAEREVRQLLNLSPDRIEALQLMTLLQLEQGRGSQIGDGSWKGQQDESQEHSNDAAPGAGAGMEATGSQALSDPETGG